MKATLRKAALASVLAIGALVGLGTSTAQAQAFGYPGVYSRGYGGMGYRGYGYRPPVYRNFYGGYGRGYGAYGRGYGAYGRGLGGYGGYRQYRSFYGYRR